MCMFVVSGQPLSNITRVNSTVSLVLVEGLSCTVRLTLAKSGISSGKAILTITMLLSLLTMTIAPSFFSTLHTYSCVNSILTSVLDSKKMVLVVR